MYSRCVVKGFRRASKHVIRDKTYIAATPATYVPWRSQRTAYGTGIHLDQSVADAFRYYRATLLITLTDIHSLANRLSDSKGLVSREQLEHAQLLTLTPTEKKVHLLF